MPDWIAHIAFAFIIAWAIRAKRKELIVLGAFLPDMERIFSMALTPAFGDSIFFFALPFHTAIFMVFLSIAIAALFIEGINWKKGAGLLLIGAFSHLLLDSFMTYTLAGVRFFWPVSYYRIPFELFPTHSFMPALILGLVAGIIITYGLVKKK